VTASILKEIGRRRFGTLSIVAVVVVLLMASGAARPDIAQAGDPPGMAISGPASVQIGQTFQINVTAAPAPSVGVAGYSTEIILPTGLKWQQRPACADEMVATHSGGSAPVVCIVATGPNGEIRHVAATGIIPPLPPLDTPVSALIEIDAQCNTLGSYKVALIGTGVAPAGSAFGAAYFDTNNVPIGVTTISQDIDVDGDTDPDFVDVADGTVIDCVAAPPPTDTPTTQPPTSTPTPCVVDGATCTPTSTPTTTPTSTPTATPPGPTGTVVAIIAPPTGDGGDGASGAGGFRIAIGVLMAAAVAGIALFGWRRYAAPSR
jgi:hypothetical protein